MTLRAVGAHAGPRSDSLEPYRHLAARVIAQALRDASTPGAGDCRESARAFLAGTPMLAYWCGVAAIHPDAVRRRVAAMGAAHWSKGARRAPAHSA